MLEVPLYAGPQEQDKLAKLAPGLDLSVDYGWLTIIAVPLFWVLSWMYRWVGNWGIAGFPIISNREKDNTITRSVFAE